MPHLFIDADGCPVIDIAIKVAEEFKISVTIICDTSHEIYRDGAHTICVSKGADAVDFVLVNKIRKGDIVITQDYGLAAMVLARSCYAINQNGRLYTSDNIDQLLGFRHISSKVRRGGGRVKGPKKRTKEQDLQFELKFRELCSSLKK